MDSAKCPDGLSTSSTIWFCRLQCPFHTTIALDSATTSDHCCVSCPKDHLTVEWMSVRHFIDRVDLMVRWFWLASNWRTWSVESAMANCQQNVTYVSLPSWPGSETRWESVQVAVRWTFRPKMMTTKLVNNPKKLFLFFLVCFPDDIIYLRDELDRTY